MRLLISPGVIELDSTAHHARSVRSASELLDEALAHHHAGRLPEADAIYQSLLQAQPHNPDALHLSGVIAHQTGRNEIAVKLIEQVIK